MPPDGALTQSAGRGGGSSRALKGRRFSTAEVAQHATPEDCWITVRGKVYDVTEWFVPRSSSRAVLRLSAHRVPTHPGGPLIYVAAGKDCTQLFDSYHPLRVAGLLPKYEVGELQLAQGEAVEGATYETDLGEGQFYNTLKRRVEAYFRDNKVRSVRVKQPRHHLD